VRHDEVAAGGSITHAFQVTTDNGTDMYVSGTMDPAWDNDVLNPAFHSLAADDFEVLELGWGSTPGR
jgi:hypothetical protein